MIRYYYSEKNCQKNISKVYEAMKSFCLLFGVQDNKDASLKVYS
jgi:hypothetical protein